MSNARAPIKSIAIIGAGIVGLSSALEFARRGVQVSLYEWNWPPRGASWAAAGMLAPAFEAIGVPGGHPKLFDLCDAGARRWPEWANRLERESGMPSGYQPGPSLAVAFTEQDAARFTAVEAALSDHDAPPEFCTDRLGAIEPTVTDKVHSALLLPSDGQADNRQTLQALIACVEQHKLIQIQMREAPLSFKDGTLDHAGHDATLITAGWQSPSIAVEGERDPFSLLDLVPELGGVEPIAGQMLSLKPIENGPNMTIRSGHVYIVPKADRIVVGATSEPGRVLSAPEPQQIESLRAQAVEICPVLADAPILESWAGVRPGLKNHAPVMGETKISNLFVATGHYRNGILLAPITAEIMADLILEGDAGELGDAFAPVAAAE